jgi:AN1-type zinc finger and ubiquitin domain-containing protein 1
MPDSSDSEGEELESELEQSGYYHDTRGHLFLFIETLTGTSFEMRVSPFETIVSIKAKLQQLEGIPVGQQHLLHNSRELPNKLSLYECGVTDGATLRLVLGLRGGPINTRKVVLQEESRELEEAVERSREELLDQIPEGGHVTVLVFRDGDSINLYHVLERPDGSYSPLSDSWSGASIRNLFAEQEEPEVEQRIRENANTMSKMHDLRGQLEQAGVRRQHTVPHESPRRAPGALGPAAGLPPIRRHRSLQREEAREGAHRLPKVKVDKQGTIDFDVPTPTPPQSGKRNANKNTSRLSSGRQLTEATRPTSQRRRPSKLISLDVSELKKTVDDNEGFAPALRLRSRERPPPVVNRNEVSDIFHRPPASPRAPTALPPRVNDNEQSDIFHRAARSPPRPLPTFLTSGREPRPRPEPPFNLNLGPPAPPSPPLLGAPRGLERRLLHSRRGRLGRREGGGSPSRVPTVLASPKGHSRERVSPRSSPRLMRPSFPTRPLSGPKRKKTPKPRCAESECRKKINITSSYSCRCELAFCAKHRHPEAHACTYDYKTEGRKLLKASNPMITVPKLPKI